MEFIVLFVVVLVAVVVYKMLTNGGEGKLTEAESLEKSRIAGEKLNALGNSIKTMTIAQIVAATGMTERGLKTRMIRRELVCADYDGVETKKRLDADAGKSASQLSAERMEKQTIGTLSPKVKCSHCDTIGQVYKNTNATQTETTQSSRLTAAILEGQKITNKKVTQFHCKNCETTWNI